jgi:hypothetical protein
MALQTMLPVLALITTVHIAPPVPQAPGWQAWHGCWELAGDDAPAGRLLCVLPGAAAAEVRFISVVGALVEDEVVLRADGSPQPVAEGGCTGTETATRSRDGHRVFVRTELDCDGYRRISSGALAMISEEEWVDVRTATIFDQHLTRTLRYRAVPAERVPVALRGELDTGRPLVRQTARLAAAAPLGLADVVEASARMPGPAVQALLVARGSGFDLNGRQLLELADAGVGQDVIDVMVALAYPRHFAIRQPAAELSRQADRYDVVDSCYDPFLRRMFYGSDCAPGYGYGVRSQRYGSYGYRYSPWDRYGYGWDRGGPTVIIVEPQQPPLRAGELVRGAGYTRGGASGADSGRGTAQPRSTTASGGSGGGGTSSAGATAGSSSGSTAGAASGAAAPPARTAQPRNNNGGGN